MWQRPIPSASTNGWMARIAFPAKNLAADHPKQRAAIEDLLGPLRYHPGGVIALALARSQLTFGLELLRDPVLQILDGIAADAKLDQVQHVFRVRLSGRSWPLFDRLLVRSGQSQATDPIPPWRGSSSRLCPISRSPRRSWWASPGANSLSRRQLLIRQHSRGVFLFSKDCRGAATMNLSQRHPFQR